MREFSEVKVEKQGIDLIASSRQVAGLEKQIAADINSNFLLRKALEPLSDAYDYCLIDTAPGMGSLILASLVAAQYVVIPCEPEYLSIQGLESFFALINSIKEYQNKELQLAGVFFTRYSPSYRTGLHKKYYADTKAELKELLFSTTIRENVALAEAQAFQTSIFDYAPESNGAIDYLHLLTEILERISPKTPGKGRSKKISLK
jgi:chromosome partitioning protein